MPELNPITRKRLWYITVFLAMDAVVALALSGWLPPTNEWALPAIAFGLVSAVVAGAVGSFLIATRPEVKDIHAARSRE
jgi:hypothetical protein